MTVETLQNELFAKYFAGRVKSGFADAISFAQLRDETEDSLLKEYAESDAVKKVVAKNYSGYGACRGVCYELLTPDSAFANQVSLGYVLRLSSTCNDDRGPINVRYFQLFLTASGVPVIEEIKKPKAEYYKVVTSLTRPAGP